MDGNEIEPDEEKLVTESETTLTTRSHQLIISPTHATSTSLPMPAAPAASSRHLLHTIHYNIMRQGYAYAALDTRGVVLVFLASTVPGLAVGSVA